MSQSITSPTVTTTAGAIPQTPQALNAQIVALAESLAPGLTVLPGNLIEDMSSTATGAAVQLDQAQVDSVNSLTPYGANPFTLLALAQIYLGQGSTAAPASNTAVYVVFSSTSQGFVIPPGFVVSGGGYQYTVQDGGQIGAGNVSPPLFCLATQSGSWQVPANTVTTIVTSIPSGYAIACTNPAPGTPGGAAQTQAEFAAQVLQSGLVAGIGTPAYVKALLVKVAGVQPRLVSDRQKSPGWEVIVGGTGDPYAIGAAILAGSLDVSTYVGSTISVTGITNANPGVVTTDLIHQYSTGQIAQINGANGITGINGINFPVTVISPNSFSIGIDTTASGAWTSGGVVTPNFRNVTVDINQFPDTYTIPFVLPPQQVVTMDVTWNTPAGNYVNPTGVAQLAQPAIAAYINAIPVGAPINVFELNAVFTASIAGILQPALVTRLIFAVYIDGVLVAPESGTGIIAGDPEGYFLTSASSITIVQG